MVPAYPSRTFVLEKNPELETMLSTELKYDHYQRIVTVMDGNSDLTQLMYDDMQKKGNKSCWGISKVCK
jgi:hypothetical protein